MSALPTRIETEAGRPLTPLEIFDITSSPRSDPLAPADALHRHRADLHVAEIPFQFRLGIPACRHISIQSCVQPSKLLRLVVLLPPPDPEA
jgi:hypothetical protein